MRIACINYEPVSLYHHQGWSLERLDNYYNPAGVADEVCVFACGDRDWRISPAVSVSGYRFFKDLSIKCGAFRPDVIRCYEAFPPYSDYAVMLASQLNVPSYLSLHDGRISYDRSLKKFDMITAYTHTLAEKAARDLRRPVEIQLNGVDSRLFRPKAPALIDGRVAGAEYRIFTVGRNDPVKNIATVMKATQCLSRTMGPIAHVLAGPGTENIPFDGVHVGLGKLSEDMMVEYLNWCRCFLQVQIAPDLSIAACEALMVGRPVIVTDAPSGNSRSLIDETRGVLIPLEKARDPDYIAGAIGRCLMTAYSCRDIREWAVKIYDAKALKEKEAERYRRLAGVERGRAKSSAKVRENLLQFLTRSEMLIWSMRRRLISYCRNGR